MVSAAPPEGFSLFPLEAFDVDTAAREEFQILAGKILTDDSDDLDRRKKTRGHSKIRSGSPQDAFHGAMRSLNRIEGHGANYKNTHECNESC